MKLNLRRNRKENEDPKNTGGRNRNKERKRRLTNFSDEDCSLERKRDLLLWYHISK